MMSRITVTFAALIFTVGAAFSQIRPKQIGWPPSDTVVYVIVNDTTAGATQGLGKWFPVDSLAVSGQDQDWLKTYDGTSPLITDSIYHDGPVTVGADTILTGILNIIGRIDQRFPAGLENIAIGRNVMSSGTVTGDENIAVGTTALRDLTSGEKNTAIGFAAMQENATGNGNLAIGEAALQANTNGSTNVAIGRLALSGGNSPDNNVGIGYNAGAFCTTDYNVLIGYEAAGGFGFAFGGAGNVAVGAYAGYSIEGSGNVMLGDSAGYNWSGSNALFIDNGPTTSPLIKGDFAADSVHVHGRLGYRDDAGDPDRIAGLVGSQFTSLYTGFGLMITNDTLYVDTTQTGSGGGGGGANLTIEGSGPAYIIASSSGTDVDVSSDGIIVLTEPSPNELHFEVDTSILVTQYDLTEAAHDEDFWELGTTDPPDAITDTMYHTGVTAIGESTGAEMYGQLTIGNDNTGQLGIAINGYPDSNAPFLGVYPLSDDDTGYEFAVEDDLSLYIRQKIGGVPTIPFSIEPYAPTASIIIQNDGDIQVSDYPNTRDDGTAANFLGTDINGTIQSYDIGDVISEWYLVATGTPGSETITDGETVTFAGGGINTVTRSGSTILISGVEADGSTTNELNTIEENNATVQTSNNRLDFQTLFDVATDGAGEVNISLDLSEATTVTTPETDDYMIMHDAGLGQHQKILWSDLTGDILTIRESNTAIGTGNDLDFGTGFDVTGSGPTFDIDLDLGEFTTDAAPELDEFVILYDPSSGQEEKTLISAISGDTNFAEDDLTFTGNRNHDMGIYTLDLNGTVMNMTLRDENGSTGKNLKITSELGASNGVTGGIGFSYENVGVQTPQYEIQAYKHSTTKQTLTINAEQATDSYIVYEKNTAFADNTTESHIAINGGVAFTQNYEWTGTAADLTLDRSYHIVNVSGSGAIGDEINLPEVATAGDNWTGGITDAQVQVGQEYVITNFRASTNLVIRTFTGDIINDNEGGSGATYTLGPGTSVILKCVRFSGGIGYWFTYD
jgi:hypothetical protein